MKQILLFGWLGLSVVVTHPLLAFAKSPEDVFASANELYKRGDYTGAVSTYEALLSEGKGFTALYYNLGNAYYKNKKLGKAVLNYERARRLSPRDPEIRANIDFVRSLIEYKIEDKRNWYWVQFRNFLDRFRLEELVFLSLLLYLFWMGPYLIAAFLKKSFAWSRTTFVMFTLTVLAGTVTTAKAVTERYGSEAVVTQREVEVRYGPSKQDRVAFRLVEGLKIKVAEERSDWLRIELLSGETGWCEKAAVEVI